MQNSTPTSVQVQYLLAQQKRAARKANESKRDRIYLQDKIVIV